MPASTSPAPLRRRLLHDDWQFALGSWPGKTLSCSTLEWLPARVPGHLHADLVENGVIGDPFERMNELGCQWLDDQEVSYRTRFTFTADSARPYRVLRFAGLDTICRVILNGDVIAESDNMFVPLEIDVSARLVEGENALEVRFEPATRVGLERRAKYFAEHGIAEGRNRFDERCFVRKAQYMYGWDWGPRLVSAGIWRAVELLEFSARIHDVHVTQTHEHDGAVRVRATTSADAGVLVHVLEGFGPHVDDGEVARVPTPELWQPRGLGTQRLYQLTTYLCPTGFALSSGATLESTIVELESAALDVQRTNIGLRTVRLLEEPDALGRSFTFEVNGERIFAFGANWIPDHSFPSLVSRRALRERLESACAAGMNMLRVWGGGLYESDDFYELCDELGLLVWQDFPFACGYYPDTGEYRDALPKEASANVRRLRNHASLALWCGNNENLMMWQDAWGGQELQPQRYYGEHLYEEVLPAVLRELDPERPYIPTSPQGGDQANGGGAGDQHYWDVWHGRGDWKFYRDSAARFSSEYGFASSCSLRAWQRVFGAGTPAAEIARTDVRDSIVRWHDKTAKGYEVFLSYPALHYPAAKSLADWVYYSQLNQRDAIRCAIEHYRCSDFCKGSLIWQLNDCWPVQSWALIDSEAQPKSAWFELARLHAPRLLSISLEGDRAIVRSSLDNARASWAADLTFEARSLATGALLAEAHGALELRNGERKVVASLPTASLEPATTVLTASAGKIRCHALLGEPRDLALPPPAQLSGSLARDGVLELRSPTPLLDLMLTDEHGTAAFLDNCITLTSPGTVALRYRGAGRALSARSLAGEHAISWSNVPL